MIRKIICLSLALLCSASLLRAGALDCTPASQELFEVDPGSVLTLPFTIRSSQRLRLISELELPQGWQLVTPPFPISIAAGAAEMDMLTVHIPQGTPSGQYSLSYRVRDRNNPATHAACSVSVMVLPVSRLSAEILNSPERVIAGQDYGLSLSVTNHSNTEQEILLHIESAAGFKASLDQSQLRLKPGASATVRISVQTDAKISQPLKHYLRFEAATPDGSASATVKSFVEVLPRTQGRGERYFTLPATLSLELAHNQESAGMAELAGQGPLSEEGGHFIEFRFKGPDTNREPVIGEHAHYHFKYWNDQTTLLAGDQTNTLSYLTAQFLQGRGLSSDISLGSYNLSGFYTREMWDDEHDRTVALQNSYRFKEGNLSLNLMQRSDQLESRILSLGAVYRIHPAARLELEWAPAKTREHHEQAWLLNLSGNHKGANYNLRYIHAQPDHPGYYADKNYFNLDANYPLLPQLRLQLHLKHERNNLERDPALSSAGLNQEGRLGLAYSAPKNLRLRLDYKQISNRDIMQQPDFDNCRRTVLAGISQSLGRLTYSLSSEAGHIEDTIHTTPFLEHSATLFVQPADIHSYSFNLRYTSDGSSSQALRRNLNAGVRGTFKLTRQTRLHLSAQNQSYFKSNASDRATYEIGLNQQFRNRSNLGFIARYTLYGQPDSRDLWPREERRETYLALEYSMPLEIPVGYKQDLAYLSGTVRDELSGKPLKDVLVRLGSRTAVSNRQGHFKFPAVTPGVYFLEVDTARIGLDRIATVKTPMRIILEPGEKHAVELSITRAAAISGRIMAAGSANTAGNFVLGAAGSPPMGGGLLVELRCADDIRRVLSEADGSFSFRDVRPGSWTLRVYPDGLPPYHLLEQESFNLEIEAGQTIDLPVKIVPKRRRIKFLETEEAIIQ